MRWLPLSGLRVGSANVVKGLYDGLVEPRDTLSPADRNRWERIDRQLAIRACHLRLLEAIFDPMFDRRTERGGQRDGGGLFTPAPTVADPLSVLVRIWSASSRKTGVNHGHSWTP
jgi:hypothetical protein